LFYRWTYPDGETGETVPKPLPDPDSQILADMVAEEDAYYAAHEDESQEISQFITVAAGTSKGKGSGSATAKTPVNFQSLRLITIF
jgi:hypothetical protein